MKYFNLAGTRAIALWIGVDSGLRKTLKCLKVAVLGAFVYLCSLCKKGRVLSRFLRVRFAPSFKSQGVASGRTVFDVIGAAIAIGWGVAAAYGLANELVSNHPPYMPREDGFSSLDTHFSLESVSDIVQVSALDESSEVKSAEKINGEPTAEQIETLRRVNRFAKTKYGRRMCGRYWSFLRQPGKNRMSTSRYNCYSSWVIRRYRWETIGLRIFTDVRFVPKWRAFNNRERKRAKKKKKDNRRRGV